MGTCVAKTSHSCGTRKGLQVYAEEDGELSGYCFSCETVVKHPYGKPKHLEDIPANQRFGKTKEEIQEEIAEIEECSAVDLKDRRLRAAALDYYGIKVGLSQVDGKTPSTVHFPYTKDGEFKAYKTKLIKDKRFWSVGDQSDVDLFGWEQAISTGAKRLIVVEGEFDAPALKVIIDKFTDEKYEDNKPAVCSLPHGAGTAGKDLGRLAGKMRKHFKEFSFCFDSDEAGQAALEKALVIFPEATTITLPRKDANDCLKAGQKAQKAAYKAAYWEHKESKNSRLVTLDSVWEKAKEPPEFGVSWPWETVTDLTRGIRTGETIYIGAAQKMGKSEIVNALAAHLVGVHGWPILLAKPEEANVKTAKLLAGKIAHARFHDPKVPFDEKAYEKAGEVLLGDKVFMLNLYQHMGYESLRADIIEGAGLGVKAVFIDPITNLTNGMSPSDANTKLQEIAQDLAALAKDLDIVIFIFCHLRNAEGGAPHDRGGKVLTSQFAGSRAMGRSCNYMFGIEGNKDPDLTEYERNIRKFVCLDDREFGEVGSVDLFWNNKTTMFKEV